MSTDEPDPLVLELERVQTLVDLNRYEEARTRLTQLLGSEPNFAPAWYLFALAQLALGDDNAALDAADRVTALEPESEVPHILRSAALQNLRRPGAIEAARKAVSLAPDSWPAHARLAEALAAANQNPDAVLAAAARAVELAPNEAHAHYLLGSAYEMRNDQAEAERCFRQALALSPESADAHQGLARGHLPASGGTLQFFNAGRLAAAASGFRDAVGADPRGETAVANVEVAIRAFVGITSSLVAVIAWASAIVVRFSEHSVVSQVVPPVLVVIPVGYAFLFLSNAPRELRRRARRVAFGGWLALVSYAQVISVALLLIVAFAPSGRRIDFAAGALFVNLGALFFEKRMKSRRWLED